MEKYINQLLDDLAKAAEKPLQCPDYSKIYPNHPANDYKGLEYIIAWEMAPQEPLSKLFDIDATAFPPPEQLTEAQAEKLIEAILHLWEVNNVYPILPERLPSSFIVYKELVRCWAEQGIAIMPEGSTEIRFCHYIAEECPWGMEYCTCKDEDWYNDDIDTYIKDDDPDALPF